MIQISYIYQENLALRKSTWQLHPSNPDKHSANRAVDRKTSNLAWWGGECTASARGKSTAEWRVDLGTIVSIHHMLIQYATDNKDWSK